MHLMRSWALLQVTLLSGGLTILLVLDLDGTTGKTEEAGEKYPLYRWGKICLSRGFHHSHFIHPFKSEPTM